MGMIPTIEGSVIVRIKIDYTAIGITEILSEIVANPGLYSNKTIKALDTSEYYYIDSNDNVEGGATDIKPNLKSTADLVEGVYTYPTLTSDENNLDPSNGSMTSDNVNLLYLSNNSGKTRKIGGILKPSTGKTMAIHNGGPDDIQLVSNSAYPDSRDSRLSLGKNLKIKAGRGIWLFYDFSAKGWKCLSI